VSIVRPTKGISLADKLQPINSNKATANSEAIIIQLVCKKIISETNQKQLHLKRLTQGVLVQEKQKKVTEKSEGKELA